MTETADGSGYLVGQMLIAMPQMQDPRFERTVIYLCAHTEDGAMGLVINKLLDEVTFPDLLEQLDIDTGIDEDAIQIHFGGPVEAGRGFVLHSADYMQDSTLVVSDQFGMTATIDILKSIAEGDGPRRSLLALGYAGWGPGQLEGEIQQNGWLCVSADEALIFDPGVNDRWQQAMTKLGIDINMLSGDAGHA